VVFGRLESGSNGANWCDYGVIYFQIAVAAT
jgi:hypothetical protein